MQHLDSESKSFLSSGWVVVLLMALSAAVGQAFGRFSYGVLLPAVRNNLMEYKKMNFHYYEALKKAMFKPAAFMKGILLPLAQESCTLREAHLVASVMAKISVPVLHASAVLIRFCEMPSWVGTNAIFMAALINKKYSLPYSVSLS